MMKKLLLIAAVSAALSPAAFAAVDHDGAAKKGKGLDAIYSSWSLDDQQRAQIEAADQKFHQELRSLRQQPADAAGDKREAVGKLIAEHRQALAKVLNDEQIKVLEAYDRMHQPRRAKGELMRALFASWHLDDSQQQAIKEARSAMRSDLGELKTQQFDSRADKRAAFAKIKQEQRARLAKVLDPQQLDVLEKMRHVELRGPKGRPPVDAMKALVASWNLDQSKQQALEEANKALFKQLHALHGPQGKAPEAQDKAKRGERMGEVKAAFEQHRESLEKILTPTQIAALDALRPGPHGKGPHGHGPGKMHDHDHGPRGEAPDQA